MSVDKKGIARAFGANVRERREEVLTTQEALSHAAGLHRTEVGLLEGGKRVPRIDTVLRLAAALTTEPGELLRGIHVQIPGRIEMPSSTLDRTDEEANIEVGLLTLILERHPEHLAEEELIGEARRAETHIAGEGRALRRGLGRLRRAELVWERDGLIEPTVAALHFDQLPF